MTKAFDSTIALTVYNLLSTRGPATRAALLSDASRLQHPELELAQLNRVVDGLVTRGRATTEGDLVSLVDTMQARVVVSRSTHDLDKGSELGGWEGWIVKNPSPVSGRDRAVSRVRTLESVLTEIVK